MIFSAYKLGKPRLQQTLDQLIEAAQSQEELDLIQMATRFGKPTLVPDQHGDAVVIKPYEDNDEAHTFQSLFDVALSATDLQRMNESETKTLDRPYLKFEARFEVGTHTRVPMLALIQARTNEEAIIRFRELMHDPEFAEPLIRAFIEHLHEHFELASSRPELHRHSPVGPEMTGKGWEIISETAGPT